MDSGWLTVAEKARVLASDVPFQTLEGLAEAICKTDFTHANAQTEVLAKVQNPTYRDLAAKLIDCWKSTSPPMPPEALAMAISTAALAEKVRRESRSVELVWTGPESSEIPPRQTKQALLQVIDSAEKDLIVVSYAVYNIPEVRDALVKAAQRGVKAKVIVEGSEQTKGSEAYSTLKALGSAVAQACSVYVWPVEKREKDQNGKTGSLHVKCAVADAKWAYLSSANLTEYAFSINMEMGVLFRGGRIPPQVQRHFEKLIQAGVFVKV